MAFKRIDSLRWQGFSTDEKPLDVPEGARYEIVDTGEVWILFDGMPVLSIASLSSSLFHLPL